ncbi:MAG: hypothetical protein R2762_27175 [Bryobacteraceae bacterium]
MEDTRRRVPVFQQPPQVSNAGGMARLYQPVDENNQPYYVVANWTSLLKRQ